MLEDTKPCAWCLREDLRISKHYDNDQYGICEMHKKREEFARQTIDLHKSTRLHRERFSVQREASV